MFIHDIIKIKYVKSGYLPDYPPHLISDEEMFKAFFNTEDESVSFFYEMYPCPKHMEKEYQALAGCISEEIQKYLKGNNKKLPEWIYSYMIGVVVGPRSDEDDINDLLKMLNISTVDDQLPAEAYTQCYKISEPWVKRHKTYRAPTMFGEPHVIKSLRLQLADPTRQVT